MSFSVETATALQLLNLILIVGIPSVLLILLQIWLSGRESRLPGLVLPVLHIVLAIFVVVSFSAYSFVDDVAITTVVTETDGVIDSTDKSSDPSMSVGIIGGADGPTSVFVAGSVDPLAMTPLFLLLNIPTALHLAIYFIQRRRHSRRSAIDKTRIQDL